MEQNRDALDSIFYWFEAGEVIDGNGALVLSAGWYKIQQKLDVFSGLPLGKVEGEVFFASDNTWKPAAGETVQHLIVHPIEWAADGEVSTSIGTAEDTTQKHTQAHFQSEGYPSNTYSLQGYNRLQDAFQKELKYRIGSFTEDDGQGNITTQQPKRSEITIALCSQEQNNPDTQEWMIITGVLTSLTLGKPLKGSQDFSLQMQVNFRDTYIIGGHWFPQYQYLLQSKAGHVMDRVCLYYATPSSMSDGDLDNACIIFSQYDILVLGIGNLDPVDAWHEEIQYALPRIKELNPLIQIFGYVPTGTYHDFDPGSELSLEEQKALADTWLSVGATGIFLDEFGYDYHKTRAGQNAIVDYCHGRKMNVMVNSWGIDDVFGIDTEHMNEAGEYTNPDGIPASVGPFDYYMFESCFVHTISSTEVAWADAERVSRAYRYYHETHAYYDNATYYEKYGTRTVFFNDMPWLYPAKEQLLRDIIYASIALNADAFGITTTTTVGQDGFYHFSLPDDEKLISESFHPVEVLAVEGGIPIHYSTLIDDVLLEVYWSSDIRWVRYNGARIFHPVNTNRHTFETRIMGEQITAVTSAAYTMKNTDKLLMVNHSLSEEVTITLPSLEGYPGRTVIIKDSGMNASVHPITITTENSELIDGSPTRTIDIDGGAVELYCDGTGWIAIRSTGGTSEMQDYVASTVQTWILGETYTVNDAVYDQEGIIYHADINWPDGTEGEIKDVSTDVFGIEQLTFTREGTDYQLTILRDSEGNVYSTSVA